MDNVETKVSSRNFSSGPFAQLPIEVSVCVGKARPAVKDLVDLKVKDFLKLDKAIDDPVELYVGGRLIAYGALEEITDSSGNLCVRITEVVNIENFK